MMVKDEAHIIASSLRAVLPYVDSWCIVDTGSTDGTQAIVREVMADLPGELYERPWENFAHNRQVCFDLAAEWGEYVLVLDADDVWTPGEAFAWPDLNQDGYHLTIQQEETTWQRLQVLRTEAAWKYHDPVHAIPLMPGGTRGQIDGVRIVVEHTGARWNQPVKEKYRRDADLYLEALKDDPENPRYWFYLAQSYKDCGEVEKAIEAYHKRANLGGFIEEIWYSMYQIGNLHWTQEHWSLAADAYLEAFQFRPTRVEPLVALARLYRLRKQHQLSWVYASQAVKIVPPADLLLLDAPAYRWRAWDELGLAAYNTGRFVEAREITERLLRVAPEAQHDRLKQHLRFCEARCQDGDPFGSDEPRILVAGCGRSGTGFTAQVLDKAGIQCGHERVFSPTTPAQPRWSANRADSSWLCLPWLPLLAENVKVIHLVRDPLACCRSWIGIGFFADDPDPRHEPYRRALARFAPGVLEEADPVARFAAYWVTWNETIERFAQARLRIEDLDAHDGVPLAKEVSEHLAWDPADVTEAYAQVPRNFNTRKVDHSVSLFDLLAVRAPLRRRMFQLCERYGYSSLGKLEEAV